MKARKGRREKRKKRGRGEGGKIIPPTFTSSLIKM